MVRIEQMILTEDWPPSQIAGVLRKEGIHIVKQTIYNHVYVDCTDKLRPHMPHELKYTRRCKAIRPTKATNIADRVSIYQRPAEADGTRFGDWEMDTIVVFIRTCNSNAYRTFHKLHTHGETRTGVQGPANGSDRVQAAILIQRIIEDHHQDNGGEFAAHLEISKKLSVKGKDRVVVYFADSYASWQKGTVENANKPIREYIPKKTNFQPQTYHEYSKEIEQKTKRKTQFRYTDKLFLQNFLLILLLLLDSTVSKLFGLTK